MSIEEKLRRSLKDAIFVDRQLGPPNGGAAIVTVTFRDHDGGLDFFNILESLIGT